MSDPVKCTPDENVTFDVNTDDPYDVVIDKAATALLKLGIVVSDDEKNHEGFVRFILYRTPKTDEGLVAPSSSLDRPRHLHSPSLKSNRTEHTMTGGRAKWGAMVAFMNGDTVLVPCETQGDANECVALWIDSVKNEKVLITFPTITGFRNACRVDEIQRISVVNTDLMDQMALDNIRARNRIQQQADLPENED